MHTCKRHKHLPIIFSGTPAIVTLRTDQELPDRTVEIVELVSRPAASDSQQKDTRVSVVLRDAF